MTLYKYYFSRLRVYVSEINIEPVDPCRSPLVHFPHQYIFKVLFPLNFHYCTGISFLIPLLILQKHKPVPFKEHFHDETDIISSIASHILFPFKYNEINSINHCLLHQPPR